MEEFIETFHIDWKLMIAQLINFGIVFAVFYFLAAKPLKKLMKERTEEIETGLSDAKQNATMLENTKKEYDAMLAKARIEANKISQNGTKELEEKKAKMMEEAKNEAKGILESGRKNLEADKTKMVEDAKKEIASIGMLAAEKVLKSKKDISDL